jgi:hypothetical protein
VIFTCEIFLPIVPSAATACESSTSTRISSRSCSTTPWTPP